MAWRRKKGQVTWGTALQKKLLRFVLISFLFLSLILLSPHLFFLFFSRALSFLPSFSHSYLLCSLFLTGSPVFPSPVYFFLSSNIFHIAINCVLPQKSWHRYKNRQNYNTSGKFKQEKNVGNSRWAILANNGPFSFFFPISQFPILSTIYFCSLLKHTIFYLLVYPPFQHPFLFFVLLFIFITLIEENAVRINQVLHNLPFRISIKSH